MSEATRLAQPIWGNDSATAGIGPLFGLRVSRSRYIWRLGPAWAVVAGTLAAGALAGGGDSLLRLIGAIILVDSAWSAIWTPFVESTLEGKRAQGTESGDTRTWRPPYVQPASPADKLRQMVPEGRWSEVLAGVLLTVGLSLLLGGTTVLISLSALVSTGLLLILLYHGMEAPLVRALLNFGIPWLMGVGLQFDQVPGLTQIPIPALLLGAAFVVLDWGAQRFGVSSGTDTRGLWLGQAALLCVLVGLRLPWTAAAVAALLLPPSWIALRARLAFVSDKNNVLMARRVLHCGLWWWAALALSSIALR